MGDTSLIVVIPKMETLHSTISVHRTLWVSILGIRGTVAVVTVRLWNIRAGQRKQAHHNH